MGVKVCPLLVGRLGGEGRVVLDMYQMLNGWSWVVELFLESLTTVS